MKQKRGAPEAAQGLVELESEMERAARWIYRGLVCYGLNVAARARQDRARAVCGAGRD